MSSAPLPPPLPPSFARPTSSASSSAPPPPPPPPPSAALNYSYSSSPPIPLVETSSAVDATQSAPAPPPATALPKASETLPASFTQSSQMASSTPLVDVPPPEPFQDDVPAPVIPSAGASIRPKSPVVHGTFEKGDSEDDEVMVKTEFVWADGAEHDVKLSGAWNGWMPVQMYHEGGGMWSVVTPVPAGTHEFKFVVDGEWKHSTRHPTVGASEETLNNIRVIRGPPKNKQNTARLSEQRNKQAGMSAPKKKGCCIVS